MNSIKEKTFINEYDLQEVLNEQFKSILNTEEHLQNLIIQKENFKVKASELDKIPIRFFF